MYWLAITQIEAQELLLGIRVASFPQTKEEHRNRLHREWTRAAYPNTDSGPELTTEQLASRLKVALNG